MTLKIVARVRRFRERGPRGGLLFLQQARKPLPVVFFDKARRVESLYVFFDVLSALDILQKHHRAAVAVALRVMVGELHLEVFAQEVKGMPLKLRVFSQREIAGAKIRKFRVPLYSVPFQSQGKIQYIPVRAVGNDHRSRLKAALYLLPEAGKRRLSDHHFRRDLDQLDDIFRKPCLGIDDRIKTLFYLPVFYPCYADRAYRAHGLVRHFYVKCNKVTQQGSILFFRIGFNGIVEL